LALLGDGGVPVEAVERFLAFLSSIERSPNTVRAYAHDLKDWFGCWAWNSQNDVNAASLRFTLDAAQ
jgi:hypothetical protein